MKINRIVMLSLLAMASARQVSAQPGIPLPLPDPGGFAMTWQGVDGQGMTFGTAVGFGPVDLVAVEPFEKGRPVTGAPYSAEAVTEVTQALADGNRIQRKTSAKIVRDGQGRVRREQQAMALGGLVAEADALIITISDPVAGTFVTFNQGSKTAMRSRVSGLDERGARIAMEGKMAGPGKSATAGVMFGPAVSAKPFTGGEPNVAVDTQSLGTQDIEGVKAEGTRTTTTIPAGAIGNELPIEMVGERWYSPELQVVVLTKRSDPRFGETVYRLTNIVRGEPASTLFQVPPDVQIQEPRMVPRPRVKPEGR